MKSENNIIDVKGLTKTYGELTVIKDLTFSIKEGEIFFLAGGSGCGKSTVLKQLIGLETPDTAEIYINGKNFFEEQTEIVKQFGVLLEIPMARSRNRQQRQSMDRCRSCSQRHPDKNRIYKHVKAHCHRSLLWIHSKVTERWGMYLKPNCNHDRYH